MLKTAPPLRTTEASMEPRTSPPNVLQQKLIFGRRWQMSALFVNIAKFWRRIRSLQSGIIPSTFVSRPGLTTPGIQTRRNSAARRPTNRVVVLPIEKSQGMRRISVVRHTFLKIPVTLLYTISFSRNCGTPHDFGPAGALCTACR